MTDEEREAQIRKEHSVSGHCDPGLECDQKYLLRRLDEARAEITRLNDLLDGAENQIDKLRAPPGTSAIKRAKRALENVGHYLIMNETDHDGLAADLASEIQQAARDSFQWGIEAADALYEKMWEDRAADGTDQFTQGLLAGKTELMNAIRALTPSAPPQSEISEIDESRTDEHLGREVRRIWEKWAKEQFFQKISWTVPWDELSEPEREVDRRIGSWLWRLGYRAGAYDKMISYQKSAPSQSGWRPIESAPEYEEVWVGGAYKLQHDSPRSWIARARKEATEWWPTLPARPTHWYPAKPPPFPVSAQPPAAEEPPITKGNPDV